MRQTINATQAVRTFSELLYGGWLEDAVIFEITRIFMSPVNSRQNS
jgi:hypothetical protein